MNGPIGKFRRKCTIYTEKSYIPIKSKNRAKPLRRGLYIDLFELTNSCTMIDMKFIQNKQNNYFREIKFFILFFNSPISVF
jgi:hypothetical protein